MTRPVLYSFRRCPYAIRARLAIIMAGVEVELREVVLRRKPAHLLEVSPKATVPVLILEDGSVIEQSVEIMAWALSESARDLSPRLTHPGAEQRALIEQNDTQFKAALDRYKYHVRHPEHPKEVYRAQGLDFLYVLEDRLGHHAHLFGDEPSFADLAIMPFVRQFKFVDAAWFTQHAADIERVNRWLDGWLAADVFDAVMRKVEEWSLARTSYVFGG